VKSVESDSSFDENFLLHGSRSSLHGSRSSLHGSRSSLHGSRSSLHGSRGSFPASRFVTEESTLVPLPTTPMTHASRKSMPRSSRSSISRHRGRQM